MTTISNEIFPMAFYIIALIFYLGFLSSKRPKTKKIFNFKKINTYDDKIYCFLEDSEKKLQALKELYFQELISKELYIKNTNKIANVVSINLGKKILDFESQKNNQVFNEIRNGIETKIKNKDLNLKSYNIDIDVNIDSLLTSINNKIKSKERTI